MIRQALDSSQPETDWISWMRMVHPHSNSNDETSHVCFPIALNLFLHLHTQVNYVFKYAFNHTDY